MSWCPNCKTEYRDGIENCGDCGAKLLYELPEESSGLGGEQDDNLEEFLLTATDELQADILESKLKFYGIPIHRKYRESGDYLKIYMGATPFGIDIYVPGELLEQARELIAKEPDASVDNEMPEASGDTAQEDQIRYNTMRKNRSRVLLIWLFVIPLLLILVISLINSILK